MGECGFCIHVAKDRDQLLDSCEHRSGSIKVEGFISWVAELLGFLCTSRNYYDEAHFWSEFYFSVTTVLTPCSKILLEELIVSHVLNKLPALGGKSHTATSKYNLLLNAHISLDAIHIHLNSEYLGDCNRPSIIKQYAWSASIFSLQCTQILKMSWKALIFWLWIKSGNVLNDLNEITTVFSLV
jgi:hypothetical protein